MFLNDLNNKFETCQGIEKNDGMNLFCKIEGINIPINENKIIRSKDKDDYFIIQIKIPKFRLIFSRT